jgi:hypothetical protein
MLMHVTIEFFRSRGKDDALALIGRETADARNLEDAIGMGRRLGLTLHMPQRPDAMAILDRDGNTLYAGSLATPVDRLENHSPGTKNPDGSVTMNLPQRNDRELGRWENEGGSTRYPPLRSHKGSMPSDN